jgi:uncharacterized protein YndB with AHSA1/START domain
MPALTHEFLELLQASRERVFRALTDEAELTCWFAEHVEVEARAGCAYRFWGTHTYGAPLRAQAMQKVHRIEPHALLAFSWPLEGCDSEVTLELSERTETTGSGAATVLKGLHHFPNAPDVPRPLDLVADLWRMTLANLKAHLAGGTNVCLPDFSDRIPRLRQTVLIHAPRDKVFQSLLDSRGDICEGAQTRTLEEVEDTKLVVEWLDSRSDPDTRPPRRVTWVLESVAAHTRVILIQEPFERTTDLSDYPQRWGQFLGRLKAHVEA